jgi:hypothetical protein
LPEAAPTCFHEFSEAIEFATQGRVRVPQAVTLDELDDDLLNGPELGPLATNVIAIEYQHKGFQGASYTITNSKGCATHKHSLKSMKQGWNDIISSAKAFAGCNHSRHYEHVGYKGAVKDCKRKCSYIGDAMNDRTSSIRWTR